MLRKIYPSRNLGTTASINAATRVYVTEYKRY